MLHQSIKRIIESRQWHKQTDRQNRAGNGITERPGPRKEARNAPRHAACRIGDNKPRADNNERCHSSNEHGVAGLRDDRGRQSIAAHALETFNREIACRRDKTQKNRHAGQKNRRKSAPSVELHRHHDISDFSRHRPIAMSPAPTLHDDQNGHKQQQKKRNLRRATKA